MNTIVLWTDSCSCNSSSCRSRRITGSSAENGSSISSTGSIEREPAGEADALLHAAGELLRHRCVPVAEADQFERLGGATQPFAAVDIGHFERPGDVLDHVAVRQQPEVLEDHRDFATAQLAQRGVIHRGDFAAADPNLARGRLNQSVDAAHQRRFAAAREAHDDEDLAAPDIEAHVGQRNHSARRLLNLLL